MALDLANSDLDGPRKQVSLTYCAAQSQGRTIETARNPATGAAGPGASSTVLEESCEWLYRVLAYLIAALVVGAGRRHRLRLLRPRSLDRRRRRPGQGCHGE